MADDTLALIQADTGLTPVERLFADTLLSDPDMSVQVAADAAGLSRQAGTQLLKVPRVRAYLSSALQTRRERFADIRDAVIQGLYSLATYDIAHAIGPDGMSLSPDKLPDKIRNAVKSARLGRYGWEYTFVDRSTIQMQLARHFGDGDKIVGGIRGGQVAEVTHERVKIKYFEGEE